MIAYENLRLVNQPYEEEFQKVLTNFLAKGWYILGERVKLFEEEFAYYCGSKYCIGLASGLDALYLSLLALELPKGAEVLVPSNTYIATITSIVNAGLKPVLVEPKIETYNIDPALIEENINCNTKAIMVVHLYGKPCEMEAIMAIANQYNIPVIEDCAQSHGATVNHKMTGTWGLFGAFSFYPTKNLGALGDAGAIVTDNEEMAIKLKALRNYGSHKKYYNDYIGINSRLDELQAAFLSVKLKDLDRLNAYKKELAQLYLNNINNPNIILPVKQENISDAYHIFNIRCNQRDQLKEYLLNKGIMTEIHYPLPPNQQKGYLHEIGDKSFPISELIHQTTLSLPISFSSTVEEVMFISSAINDFNPS